MLAYPVVCVGHAQVLEWVSFKACEVTVGTASKVPQQTAAFVLLA